MRTVKNKLTDDLITLNILEKVKPERRHSTNDLQKKSNEKKPIVNASLEHRRKFRERILNDLQCTQFKRKTLNEAPRGYVYWIKSVLEEYNRYMH